MRRPALFASVFSFFVLFLLSFFLITPAHASNYITADTDADVPPTLHNYTQTIFLEVFSAIGCQVAGIDLANLHERCLGLNLNSGKIGYVSNGGLIGTTLDAMGALYTPPASLSDYTKDMARSFGIVKPAYAATNCPNGIEDGYCAISPLINIWKIFRNIVYLFFVIIFVIIGFTIMLRIKIDPRTVMSIENQLPKLIIGLILVTFSFAIAGFLIDLMWILTFLIINILTPNIQGLTVAKATGNLFQNPIGYGNEVLPGGIFGVAAGSGGSVAQLLRSLFTSGQSSALGLTPPGSDGCAGVENVFVIGGLCHAGEAAKSVTDVLGNIGGFLANVLSFIISWIVGIIGVIVVLIALLVALFRVWFSLLMSYIYILLDIVFAPFYIIFGAIPGSKISFSAWLRDMAANLIAFPVVIGVLLLGRLFMQAFTPSGTNQALFVPPLIGNPNSANTVTSDPGNNPLGWLIGLAIVMVTPAIVSTMKELFKAPANKLGAAAIQGLSMGGKAFSGLAKNTFSTLASNDIRYNDRGEIETVKGLPSKAFTQFKKAFGAR